MRTVAEVAGELRRELARVGHDVTDELVVEDAVGRPGFTRLEYRDHHRREHTARVAHPDRGDSESVSRDAEVAHASLATLSTDFPLGLVNRTPFAFARRSHAVLSRPSSKRRMVSTLVRRNDDLREALELLASPLLPPELEGPAASHVDLSDTGLARGEVTAFADLAALAEPSPRSRTEDRRAALALLRLLADGVPLDWAVRRVGSR